MNYVLPEKQPMPILLEGFNTDWLLTDHGVHSVTYTNLTPGKYTLMVRPQTVTAFGVKNPHALQIRIKPPFWLSAGALSSMLFF
jgi:hypothetical protein